MCYGIILYTNAITKYTIKIQVFQNDIVKVGFKVSCRKMKLSPPYSQSHPLELNNIFKLDVLKFVYKFVNKSLSKCFINYSLFVFHTYNQWRSYPLNLVDKSRGGKLLGGGKL